LTIRTALLILASLADADRHGYAIKKDVAERSAGDARLGSTTLYRILGHLLDEGPIEDAASTERPYLAPRQPRIPGSREWTTGRITPPPRRYDVPGHYRLVSARRCAM
jgi:Transcriptional regulator PadR-like family